jgi:hypothetical protein
MEIAKLVKEVLSVSSVSNIPRNTLGLLKSWLDFEGQR